MGRSKFPGKPPKTATRKRIKVLGQPEAAQNDSVTVAENIYYGLSLFNETFGDNEKVRGKKKSRRAETSAVCRRRHRRRRRRPPSPSSSSQLPSPSSLAAEVARDRRASRRATHRVSPLDARRSPLARIVRRARITRTRTRWTRDTRPDEPWRGVARGLTYRRWSTAAIVEWQVRDALAAFTCRSTIRFSLLPPLPYVGRAIAICIRFPLAALGTEYVSETCLLQLLLRNFLAARENVELSGFASDSLSQASCYVEKVKLVY